MKRRDMLAGTAASLLLPSMAEASGGGGSIGEALLFSAQGKGSGPDSLSIGEHNTVSSGADNGANNCSAAHLWNSMRHSTTRGMVSNLFGRLQTQGGNLNVSGHGNSGLFECGSGQAGGYNEETDVYAWNQYYWGPILQSLKNRPFAILSIYSCHTGADQDGADLLYNMAVLINRPVRARTGLTTCGGQGIGFPQGTWQLATPTSKPKPIPKTGEGFAVAHADNGGPYIFGNLGVRLQLSSISRIELQRRDKSRVVIDGREALSFARALLATEEVDIGGSPLAILTGVFTIYYTDADGPRTLMLDLYNDMILMARGTSMARFVAPGLVQSIR